MNQLIINYRETEKRAAVIKDSKVTQLYIEQPDQASVIGNIYLGIVEKVVPSMKAAFVNIGSGLSGYLHIGQLPSYQNSSPDIREKKSVGYFLREGEKILVQVTKDRTDTKAYQLTGMIELFSNILVYRPEGRTVAVSKKLEETKRLDLKNWGEAMKTEAEGILFRTSAVNFSKEELDLEFNRLRNQFAEIYKTSLSAKAPAILFKIDPFERKVLELIQAHSITEIHCDDFNFYQQLQKELGKNEISISYYNNSENIFNVYHLEQVLESSLTKVVPLNNGASLVIEEAEALTIIDVNSGSNEGIRGKDRIILETNVEAAKEVARQIQLRNLSGIILVDFINMKNELHKEKVLGELKRSLRSDPNLTTVHGFTKLGIVEITRKRTTPSLLKQLSIECSICNGTGNVASSAAVAFQLERELWQYKGQDFSEVMIETTADVLSFFKGEQKQHLKQLEDTLGFKIRFLEIESAKPHYHIKRTSY